MRTTRRYTPAIEALPRFAAPSGIGPVGWAMPPLAIADDAPPPGNDPNDPSDGNPIIIAPVPPTNPAGPMPC